MPHATAPPAGFQAFILCGPGASLDTFTSDAAEFPKAIVPIANRPMVWYPIDWLCRMGVTESKPALEAALSQNPHLTSLPTPKPDVITPEELTINSGTAEIFQMKEVRDAITGDFIVLPCDLVCELEGVSLLTEWMTYQAGFAGASGGLDEYTGKAIAFGAGGEKMGRRGGLGVWYDTRGEDAVKDEETDFIVTVPLPKPIATPTKSSLRNNLAKLVYALPTDTLEEDIEEQKAFNLSRHVFAHSGRPTIKTGLRDAHIYFLPFWTVDMMQAEDLENLSEDVIGNWAKATWDAETRDELGLNRIFHSSPDEIAEASTDGLGGSKAGLNVADFSTTLQAAKHSDSVIPPILAYTHSQLPEGPFLRRVDTSDLLMATSLRLAKLPASTSIPAGSKASPLTHPFKIAHPDKIPLKTRVEAASCLVAENVAIAEKCNIKESVIGAGCTIGEGVRLVKCILMDDVVVGDYVSLSECIIGPHSKIEGGSKTTKDKTDLRNCEVARGFIVPWGTDSKGEKFVTTSFEELEEGVDFDGDVIEPLEDDGLSHK